MPTFQACPSTCATIRTDPVLPGSFDVVTAARTPRLARGIPRAMLRAMIGAARPRGLVLALEYNQEKIEWSPEPPASMRRFFYGAFVRWRAERA